MIKYTGSCHCKSIQFQFTREALTSALQCNCSICIRKNAIMSPEYIDINQFELLKGKEDLSIYLWGDKDVNHYFCKNCGIHTFHDATNKPGHYRVNLCCVDNITPRSLAIKEFDGKNLL